MSAMPLTESRQPLHRLREVRRRESISVRTMATRLGLDICEVREQENPYRDLSLSTLLAWQRALGVPMDDLLIDSSDALTASVAGRAALIQIMRTARTLQAQCNQVAQPMVDNLLHQLLQLMPELAEVDGWQSVGKRRSTHELGQAAATPVCVPPALRNWVNSLAANGDSR